MMTASATRMMESIAESAHLSIDQATQSGMNPQSGISFRRPALADMIEPERNKQKKHVKII